MNRFCTCRDLKRSLLALLAATALLVLPGCDGDEPADPEHGPVLQTGGGLEPAPDVRNDPEVVSPPILHEPALQCGTAVRVSGFAPGATIRILEGGTNTIGMEVGFDPEGQMIGLTIPLEDDWLITAVQEIDGTVSSPSNEVEVQGQNEAYPAGLPRPELDELPLYSCGAATVVRNLPVGGEVEVFTDGRVDPISRATGVWSGQSVGINPAFVLGDAITAISSLCGIPSPVSTPPRIVQPAPATLPAPGVPELHDGGTILTVDNLVNGARVVIRDQATGDVVWKSVV